MIINKFPFHEYSNAVDPFTVQGNIKKFDELPKNCNMLKIHFNMDIASGFDKNGRVLILIP